ncbi:Haloacid dehalogenase domain protein hydrolase OS=Tsukamurella paurometabola (strain ATCC 8368 / DSM / CCUG 35730 / CIP 100753 / JCM 10117 / KCTC 9821 /NBRC 16120 / NCIMB 702349 / NCTC 13040) OX=521096 GN=Tpau_2102 PE=4 SV=1 [Tsukamurella paurometabola]|uniref:Haloacid dehalogenase domain protein hydrolase n=1 Tax=Tsukamurella paurometabola (strain ATCC 8368 / DSM 20162 / CCUG 35730 / CIP 100753 / JCM 10117 / KCTC 9821 / NBRC 16120 / NCIMB 702349 / NCTC 13040) TaxID=521096 RepID=D5UPF8_TSUPD|nr:phosphonatase-like hydrolase [Tsukamurella paurometabola]ADG78714.1 Haloacid dehalogenase domain protein hydrolase [Tsukamurella paurometabola DSM 20162]SUP32853.1 Phosphonoacetaldehyde hydrolase [Tsukamurella paurometabola]
MNNPVDLVALDMAGTTIDDGGAVYEALRGAVEDAGASVAQSDLQVWMGTDKVEAITHLLRLGGIEPTDTLVAAGFRRFRERLAEAYAAAPPRAIEGVPAALAELRARGIAVALTTGFDDAVAYPLLAALGWKIGTDLESTVDAVVTTSDVPAGRPAPYLIHRAMEKTGARDVRRVLAAGDTAVDVQAASNAGAISVGVLTGKADPEVLAAAGADHVLDGVTDLPALLAAPAKP